MSDWQFATLIGNLLIVAEAFFIYATCRAWQRRERVTFVTALMLTLYFAVRSTVWLVKAISLVS